MVAIGGTVRGLFRLLRASETGPNGRIPIEGEIGTDELVELAGRLCELTSAQRLELPGVSARRVDLLPTGAVIVATLAQRLGATRLRICDWGPARGRHPRGHPGGRVLGGSPPSGAP